MIECCGLVKRYAGELVVDGLDFSVARSETLSLVSADSTDGRIAAYGLRVLEDDRSIIPPYDAVVLGGEGVRGGQPGLWQALTRLEGAIGGETMRAMNAAVDLSGQTPASVAENWLACCRPVAEHTAPTASDSCIAFDPLGRSSDAAPSSR